MSKSEAKFITDIEKLRELAKTRMDQGVITENYQANKDKLVELLNIAHATELICELRYKNHYYTCKEIGAKIAADEFLEHAQEERGHAEKIANRIMQLGSIPKTDPNFIINNSHAKYVECDNIKDMIRENLIAERIAVYTYRELIQYIGNDDPTTRRMLEDILATEEEHVDDIQELSDEYQVTVQ